LIEVCKSEVTLKRQTKILPVSAVKKHKPFHLIKQLVNARKEFFERFSQQEKKILTLLLQQTSVYIFCVVLVAHSCNYSFAFIKPIVLIEYADIRTPSMFFSTSW